MDMRRCVNCMGLIDEDAANCPNCGYNQREEQSPFVIRPGTILHGRYLTGRMLGQGGFGITYVGYDLTLDIRVAIKEYFPAGSVTRNHEVSNQVQRNTSHFDQKTWQAGCESFLKEARKMAKIDSLPGIVRVRDTFPENQTAYIVMDFIEGETLKQRLFKTGPMKYTACVRLLRPLMESLGRIHSQGLIHRDISPDNIMVQPDGSVCLLDFGAAKDISFQQTAVSRQVAKKGFSPPEQYREKGNIGPWTDVYALCATIYYCITGKLVPDAMDRTYGEKLDFNVPMKEPLSADAMQALADGMKLRAEERIQTVEELLKRLEMTRTADAYDSGGGQVNGQPASDKASTAQARPASANASTVQQRGSGKGSTRIFGIAVAVILGVLFMAVAGTMIFSRKPAESVRVPDPVQKPEAEEAVGTVLAETEIPKKAASEPKPQISSLPVFDDTASESPGVLMQDASGQLEEGNIYYGTVLGSQIAREDIVTVTFLDTLDRLPAAAPDKSADVKDMAGLSWDVSWEQNGTVMAWIEENWFVDDLYDLYIAADGGVKAQDCTDLFAGYISAESINFNDCFDTSQTESMCSMFLECASLRNLDISSFDTSRVTNMGLMFCLCESLERLELGDMDTDMVVRMDMMFAGCGELTGLDVSGFGVESLESCEGMFVGCAETAQQAGFVAAEKYILPGSDSRYLYEKDLQGLSKEECRIARNEIFARHGRMFEDEELQMYFCSCCWYVGSVAPEDFDDSVLNEYEVANRDLIVKYEQEKGYR